MKTNTKMLIGMIIFSSQVMSSQITLIADYIKVPMKIEVVDLSGEVLNLSRYDYYPNLQAYFDTKTKLYIYTIGGKWVFSKNMAPNYRGYGLRNNFHVVINNYSGEKPYSLLSEHKLKYPADFSSKRRMPLDVAKNDLTFE